MQSSSTSSSPSSLSSTASVTATGGSKTAAATLSSSIGASAIKKTPVTTTNNSNSKFMQPNKPSGMKTIKSSITSTSHSTTVPLLSNGTSSAANRDLQTSLEIEEISKKISEHADALYRTWKSHGIAPTEILELYTAEAAAAAGAITEDVKSTEGLQKLVNSFVIKDKEQRGVKTTGKSGGSSLKSPILNKNEQKLEPQQSLKSPTQALNINKSISSLGSPTSPKTSTPAYLINSNKLSGGRGGGVSGLDVSEVDSPLQSNKPSAVSSVTKLNKTKSSPQKQSTFNKTSITTPSSSSGTPSKPMDFSLNLDINLDLNLDVQALTLQQSENLQKIKELLKHEPAATGRATKIPTVIVEKTTPHKSTTMTNSNAATTITTNTTIVTPTSPSANVQMNEKTFAKAKESKTLEKSSSTKSVKKPLVIVLEENKQNEESKVQKKLATAIDSNETPLHAKKIGNKLKTSTNGEKRVAVANNAMQHSFERQHEGGHVDVDRINQTLQVIDNKLKKSDKDRDKDSESIETITVTGKKRTTGAARATSPITTSVNASDASSISSNTLLNGTVDLRSLENLNANENLVQQLVQPLEEVIKKTATKATKTSKTAKEKSKESSNTKASAQKTRDSPTSSPDPATPPSPSSPSPSPSPSPVEVTRSSSGTMLTPSKLKTTRPLSNGNGQDKNSRSPFLTRGSVAERVLMFEKCPDSRLSFLNIKRPDPADAPPKSLLKAKLHATPPAPVEHNSLQKEIRSTKSVYIPRFYFPHGKPQPNIALERTLRNILSAFDKFPNNQVTREELPQILKICGLPFYWRMPVMVFCQQGNSGLVERQKFIEFWKQMNVYCHDEASRFVYILSRGQRVRSYILPEDLAPLVQDVVDTHPGLAFLKEATEFHSRYVHTVIARIFYNVNRSWSGRISISELKKSDLLEIIALLEEEDDINQIMAFFSYEHFYVIYCKFWELDKDHDLLISLDDLARHSDHALSTRIVERIFSGCVTRNDNKKNPDDEPKMSYTDFVWFLLSEEDKRTPTAIEYWFRCMDVDGDGVLSMYELEYFYEEQQQRMESIGIESLPFEDCLCQMLDMIKPKRRDAISLSDLKNCKMTHVFFDTFFNLEKYLDHEQRDPFATQRDEYSSDWDRFAAQEYELLITEEND